MGSCLDRNYLKYWSTIKGLASELVESTLQFVPLGASFLVHYLALISSGLSFPVNLRMSASIVYCSAVVSSCYWSSSLVIVVWLSGQQTEWVKELVSFRALLSRRWELLRRRVFAGDWCLAERMEADGRPRPSDPKRASEFLSLWPSCQSSSSCCWQSSRLLCVRFVWCKEQESRIEALSRF